MWGWAQGGAGGWGVWPLIFLFQVEAERRLEAKLELAKGRMLSDMSVQLRNTQTHTKAACRPLTSRRAEGADGQARPVRKGRGSARCGLRGEEKRPLVR